MASLYPRNPTELVDYLRANPELKVRLPAKEVRYAFDNWDGVRIFFTSSDGSRVSFPLAGLTNGKVDYNEDGFTRTVGASVCNYYYTGPKPWQVRTPQAVASLASWDEIFSNINLGE